MRYLAVVPIKTTVGLVLAATLTLLIPVGAQVSGSNAKLDQFLDRLAEKNKGMGSIAIASGGKVVYSHAFGYANIDGNTKIAATPATKYRIASITKTYTAVMIFQLIDEGRLKLSDTLDRFFPKIPNAARITMAQLLNHRSGIHDLEPDGSWGLQRHTPEDVVARIAQGTPDFEPDTKHQYSNAGYVLLGQIVEKAGGVPYRDALKARITSKIGAADTDYRPAGTTDPAKNESASFRYLDGLKEAAELDFSVPAGAGAILATPADMARFIQAVFDLKIVSADALKRMMTMREDEGMGMESFSFAGRTCYGHTGGGTASGAWLAYCPEDKVAIAYVTNLKIYPVVNIVRGALDIFWNRPFDIPTFEAIEVSADILDQYVGTYVAEGAPAKPAILRRGTTLYFQPPGQTAVSLEAVSPTKFKIDPGVFFEFDVAKGAMTITRPNGSRVFTKEK